MNRMIKPEGVLHPEDALRCCLCVGPPDGKRENPRKASATPGAGISGGGGGGNSGGGGDSKLTGDRSHW